MADRSASAVRQDFDAICRRLNMDQGTLENAWQSFVDLKEYYTLEGNQNHWLACALFVACRTAVIPTVDGGTDTTGNRVTLYNIIRETRISLLEFFERMKRWVEMALKHGLPKEVPTLVDNLEHRFRVITLIYRKYDDLFQTVFLAPQETQHKRSRSKCTSSDLHKFIWTLFVHARACLNGVQDNLVNSFHLLICVVETMYLATQAERTDLINPNFSRAVEAVDDPSKEKEVVDFLCQRYEADVVEVKVIREHWWDRHLDDIREKEILLDRLHDIVEGAAFLRNSKKLNREYELYVLNVGDLDERVFLGEFAQDEVGTPIKVASGSSVIHDKSRQAARNLDTYFANANSGVVPNTPLTSSAANRRDAFKSPKQFSTPVSSALHNMSRIKSMTNNDSHNQIGNRLHKLCGQIQPNPHDAVLNRVEKIKKLFVEKYCGQGSDSTRLEEGTKIITLGTSLYYRVLEAVAVDEFEKRGTARLQSLLQADDMHLAMLGCCLQIVLTTKNTSDKMFPWIIEALDIPAYSFARVIESVIHFEPNLSSSMIKSLKVAEELLLESLVWRSGSAVFEHIRDIGRVYRYQEVALPDSYDNAQQGSSSLLGSPMPAHLRRISPRKLVFDKPDAATADGNKAASTSSETAPTTTTASSTQTAHSLTEAASLVGGAGEASSITKVTNTIQSAGMASSVGTTSTEDATSRGDQAAAAPAGAPMTPQKPIRNSVSLFLRKVYHLAFLRLKFLCQRLKLDSELEQRCWTCFEECLVQHIEELKDRHIDQFIMCSIYGISKVMKKDVDFAEIVKQYRAQPHSTSVNLGYFPASNLVKTYRQVMIFRSIESASTEGAVGTTAASTSDSKEREQAENLTPKGSPVTRAATRRQQQLKQSSPLGSPRRSPRKRQHEVDSPPPPGAQAAKRQLFSSPPSSSPPRKRRDYGGSTSSDVTASPLAEDPIVGDEQMDVTAPGAPTVTTPTGNNSTATTSAAPPGLMSPPVALPDGQCIGDIIAFYNKVFLELMRSFILQFQPEKSDAGNSPCLSPMPKNKSKSVQSPRKQVSSHHNIFVSPRKKEYDRKQAQAPQQVPQEGAFLYCHQKNALSDLTLINDHIKRNVIASPMKSPRPAAPLHHQSPLVGHPLSSNTTGATTTTVTTASTGTVQGGGNGSIVGSGKPAFVPSVIMLESMPLSPRSGPSSSAAAAAGDARRRVQSVLVKQAEEKWNNSKAM